MFVLFCFQNGCITYIENKFIICLCFHLEFDNLQFVKMSLTKFHMILKILLHLQIVDLILFFFLHFQAKRVLLDHLQFSLCPIYFLKLCGFIQYFDIPFFKRKNVVYLIMSFSCTLTSFKKYIFVKYFQISLCFKGLNNSIYVPIW